MNKNKKLDTQFKVTARFGYGLFTLLIIGLIVSTVIPFARLLYAPTARHDNIIILLVSLVLTSLLPLLIAYFIGYRAAKSHSHTERRYNGVLLGIMATWLSSAVSFINLSNLTWTLPSMPVSLNHYIPAILTIFVTLVVGILYAKTTKKQGELSSFKPYQLTLLASMIATFIPGVWLFDRFFNHPLSSELIAIVSILLLIVMVVVSYKLTMPKNNTVLNKLAQALVATSIGFIASMYVGYLFAYSSLTTPLQVLLFNTFGIVVWGTYLYSIHARK
jgi:ammonia channel protein AmtB